MVFLTVLAVIALITIIYVLFFLKFPNPDVTKPDAKILEDFIQPDNSSSRPIPALIGTKWIAGNIIRIANIKTKEIKVCQSSGGGKK